MYSQCPFYKLEDKQKSRTKLLMYPINTPSHIGEPKTDFSKSCWKLGLKFTSVHLPKSIIGICCISKSIKDITLFSFCYWYKNKKLQKLLYTNDRVRQM